MLSKAGLGSRTQARSWIHAGPRARQRACCRKSGSCGSISIATGFCSTTSLSKRRNRVYILLYKPAGYITTFKDPEGRPTVYDLIADVDTFVSPVGRLDLDTSGLLILTNDTQFAERLTNPDHKIPKTYLVKCADLISDEALDRLRQGVELSDGPTRPAVVKRVRDSGKYSHIEIRITEGRNRQVRRMVEAIGSKVLKLVRTAIGSD